MIEATSDWSDALVAALSLMAAISGPEIIEAAMQRDHVDWLRLCREADQRARQRPQDARLVRLRELLDESVTIERASTELSTVKQRAPQTTVEALMHSIREGGVKALEGSATKRRLGELSDEQAIEVGNRLQRLQPNIACAWTAEEVGLLFQVRSLRNDGSVC